MATTATRFEARRAARRRADAQSTLRAGALGPVDTYVHDLSQTGARIETETRLALGDFVTIGLGGVGAVRAIVVWNRGDQYGLDFVVPLTSEDEESAFRAGNVVSLVAPTRTTVPTELAESEDVPGVYAEATGWLSVMLFILIGGTALAVALIRGWLF